MRSRQDTWAKLHYPEAIRIDLLDENLYQAYLVNPDLFAGEMRRLQPKQWVVVDEIQRLPGLLNQVHRVKRRDAPYRAATVVARKEGI